MVSKKSWEKFKRDVECLTKTGVEKESWGKRLSNKDQNVSILRNRRTSAPTSHSVEVVERVQDDDIRGFSSSDEDQSNTVCDSVKSFPSVSKRALCHSAPVKKRKRFKKYDTQDVKDATPIAGFRRRTLDSLRNRRLAGGSNAPKVVSSNFDNSFATVSPLFALHPASSCNISSANLPDTKTEGSQEKRNESEDIAWSDSGSDGNSDREMVVCDFHTESPRNTSHAKIPFSSQQEDLGQVKDAAKAVCDIGEFESDSEKGEECADDKESVPSISPNTPTPTPTSPKIAEMGGGPPLDSAKKRKPKYLRSGLAERLRKLILRENSEKSFWFHKLRQLKEAREDDGESSTQADGSVTLRVVSSHLDHTVHVLKCDVISQDVISERRLPDRVIVLLDNETRKQLDFKSKPTYLRIYSSWKIFDLPNSCLPVLLCITHCEVLPFLPSHPEPVSSMIVEEAGSTSTKEVDQSLTKVVRARLFSSACDTKTDEEYPGNNDVMNDDGQARELRKNTSENTRNVFSSLLDVLGLQGQCLEGRLDLTGRIQRVYWRDVCTRNQTLNCRSSLVTSLIERSRVLKEERNMSLCFLSQDSAGFCSEITVSSNVLLKKAEWQEVLCTAEGSVVSFRGLRLVEHRKRKRRPGLFGLIDSLSDTMAYREDLATDKLSKRGTAKQTVCLSLSPDEETVLQRLSEEEANDCIPYHPSKSLTRTSPPLDRKRVKLQGQFLHATFNSNQRYGTNHVRLFIAGAFVANESSESDVSCSSDTGSHSLVQVWYSGRRTLGWDESAFAAGQLLSMQDLVIDNGSSSLLIADSFSNIQILIPQSTFSTRSSTSAFHVDDLWRKTSSVAVDDELYSHLRRTSRAILPELNAEIESDSLVAFEGIVFDVDQANAFCWLTCNECGSDDISELQENSLYVCNSCALDISSPVTNTHLEVYLKSASLPELPVKAKLLQKTISRLLPAAEDNSDEGYDVRCILNKHLGPMSCYVVSKLDNGRDIDEEPKIRFKLEELDDSSWTH